MIIVFPLVGHFIIYFVDNLLYCATHNFEIQINTNQRQRQRPEDGSEVEVVATQPEVEQEQQLERRFAGVLVR